MQAKVVTTTAPAVGNWVEIRKPRKGRSFLVKGSRYLVEAVNPDREAVKVGNGKDGAEYRTEHLYFDEVSLTSQFQKGDIVQHVEDPRYIGRVIKEGQQVKVKWADGSDDYVRPELINLFTRMVGGEQQIIGQYAFKEGDRVVTEFKNLEGVTFTVRECYPSGMVGLTDEGGFDKSLAGCRLSVISYQSSVTSEDTIPEPPQPESYKTFEEFNAAYSQWLEELWECKGEEADFVQVEQQFTNAREIWEQYHPEDCEEIEVSSDHLEVSSDHLEVSSEHCKDPDETSNEKLFHLKSETPDSVPTEPVRAWVNPRIISIDADTQTRYKESEEQIYSYGLKMLTGEWDWERRPLPILVWDGKYYYIVSGYHRIKAALMASDPNSAISIEYRKMSELPEPVSNDLIQVYCEIIQGTLDDAKLLAIRSDANNDHGVPESRADFRNRVEKFLDIFSKWGVATQIRELENLKLQPHASEQVAAIDQLLNRFRKQGMTEAWSSRIVAAYLRSPRSYRTINSLMATRQAESVFRSVVSSLSDGVWVQYREGEEDKIGRIIYLSKTTITVLSLDKAYVTFNSSSPLEELRSIEQVDRIEPEQPTEEPDEEEQEEDAPPPVKKSMSGGGGGGVRSVSQELNGKAKSLGLPSSPHQVLPDMGESDRLRNASPHDVDDRPFATPTPTPDVSEYLIGFVSNVPDMNQPQIRRALEAVLEWMETRGQDQNLGYLKTVIDSL